MNNQSHTELPYKVEVETNALPPTDDTVQQRGTPLTAQGGNYSNHMRMISGAALS